MNNPPTIASESEIREALERDWSFEAIELHYLSVGFRSHHWKAINSAGEQRFVKVDNERAPILERAQSVAHDLKTSGLEFVVAPIISSQARFVRALTRDHSITVFEWLDGATGLFDHPRTNEQKLQAVQYLARLHMSTPVVQQTATLDGFAIAKCDELFDGDWNGGPFTIQTQRLLKDHESSLRKMLNRYDQLLDELQPRNVITHGEPHPGNFMSVAGQTLVINWHTTAMACPERDLWFLMDHADDEMAMRYQELTDEPVDPIALELYRLRWRLTDIALFVDTFRQMHDLTPDTQKTWTLLNDLANQAG